MSLVTLKVPPQFTVGMSVKAYPDTGQQPSGPPAVAALETAVVDVNSVLTFNTLRPSTTYWAGASVSGVWLYFEFTAPATGTTAITTGDLAFDVATQAELDAAQALDVKVVNEMGNLLALGADPSGSVDATTIMQGAINAGGPTYAPPGTFKHGALTWKDGARILGAGELKTILLSTPLTGTVYDFGGASFGEISDVALQPNGQRTAGELFKLDAGAGVCQKNRFRRLRVASPYQGWTLLGCTTTLIEDIQFIDLNTAYAWAAGIALAGAATSTTLRRLLGNSGAGHSAAWVSSTHAAVDTVLGEDWDFTTNGGASAAGFYASAGEWFRLTNISLEAGAAAHALETEGTARGLTAMNVHLLGLRGAYFHGGQGLALIGGEVLQCQQEGVRVATTAAISRVKLLGLDISDVSQAATNTYDAIQIGAGADGPSFFEVADCNAGGTFLGAGNGNLARYGINVDSVNSGNYRVVNNQGLGSTGTVRDNGSAPKTVSGNL